MQMKIFCAAMIATIGVSAQTFTEKIAKELPFEKQSPANALMIANIAGSVTVEAYSGATVVVEVTKTINAKTTARLETGKAEVQLGIIDLADTLILYITEACHEFGRAGFRNRHSGWSPTGWSYQSQNNQNCNPVYEYKMDFKVKVPASINLIVSTINNGNVVVENVTGVVKARNVNGSIRLTKLHRES